MATTTFRTLRTEAGLTEKQLATLLGVAENTIKKYEISDRVPRKCNLGKWKKALNCSKQDLSKAFAYHSIQYMEKKALDIDCILRA